MDSTNQVQDAMCPVPWFIPQPTQPTENGRKKPARMRREAENYVYGW